MSGVVWAKYRVDSPDPKYADATYTIDEETDPGDFEGWFGIFIDYGSGDHDHVADLDPGDHPTSKVLSMIDEELKARGLPPRGEVVIAP